MPSRSAHINDNEATPGLSPIVEQTPTPSLDFDAILIQLQDLADLKLQILSIAQRLSVIELRLNCNCGAILANRPNHESFCLLYVAPPRTRDCFKCGNIGFIPTGIANESTLCDLCNGSGKVSEVWVDGALIWPSTTTLTRPTNG